MDTTPLDDSTSPPLDLAYLTRRLASCAVGQRVTYLATVASTMTIAAAWARDPAVPSGALVVADHQDAGRGRRGRAWDAPPGRGLLVSILLRPPHYALPLGLAPIVAGVALVHTVEAAVPELAATIALKWPNDLLVGPSPAHAGKAAGILAESVLAEDGAPRSLVLGIGVNVNQLRAELPPVNAPAPAATSLRLACGHAVDRTLLLALLCEQLAAWLTQPADAVLAAWRSRLATLGQTVDVYPDGNHAQPALTGRAVDVTPDGGLVVVDGAGHPHTIHAADVSIRTQLTAQS